MEFINVKRVAQLLDIKDKTIYKWAENGFIPHYRAGKLLRFKEEEVIAWMETKKATSEKKQVDKVLGAIYSKTQGRPRRLRKKVTP